MFEDKEPEEINNQESNENIDSDIVNENIESEQPQIPQPEMFEELAAKAAAESAIDENILNTIQQNVEQEEISEETPVTVQPVKFASFDEEENIQGKENRNLDLLMNVNLQMSVELGRTELPFKKVLELTRGSIISLDKLAGEPVELFANGKLVAFGEVVVIEDNFGLRITSIAAPEERLKTVHDSEEK